MSSMLGILGRSARSIRVTPRETESDIVRAFEAVALQCDAQSKPWHW